MTHDNTIKHWTIEALTKFVTEAFEIAFGDDAINRDFSEQEVLEELKGFSNKAYQYDEWNTPDI